MNVKLAILGVVALVSLVKAQQLGSVRGTVTSMGGEPLRKAEVQLRTMPVGVGEARVVATETDSVGNFEFQRVMPGFYLLTASRVGYLSADITRPASAINSLRAVRVAPGQEVASVALKLAPHSVISGRVLDEDGDPMFRASVSVLEESFQRGRRVLTSRETVGVNDLGEYRIPGLQPGRYYIAAEPRTDIGPLPVRARAPGQEADLSFVPMYFPGVIDAAQATLVRIESGQEARGIDIRLRRSAVVNLRGRVVDANGVPVSNVSLALSNNPNVASGAIGRGTSVIKPDGSFVLTRVPPGDHIVAATSMAREGRTTGITNVNVATRDVDNIVVRMMPPLQVAGTVLTENSADLSNIRITLDPIDPFPPDMRSSNPIGAGNAFSIPDVPQGRYRVVVIGTPEGYYAKGVQWNGEDISAKGLSVTSPITGLEITLAKGAATIQGALFDASGNKLPGGAVAAVPPQEKRNQWNLFAATIADQNGSFTLRNLPPGEYTLFGFQSGGNVSAVQNPEYLREIEAKGKVVKVAADAQETLNLQVMQ